MGHIQCQTRWTGDLRFEAKMRDREIVMDSEGPTPKELLLSSICGCSGMDVVSILKKMRVDLTSCAVDAQTETTSGYPSIFSEVRLQFRIESPNIKADQAMKAVTLSMTKYCGVSAMVAPTSPIVFEVFVNGAQVGEGRADFTGVES